MRNLHLRSVLLSGAALLLTAAPAFADWNSGNDWNYNDWHWSNTETAGWYVGAGAGLDDHPNETTSIAGNNFHTSFTPGYTGGVEGGYALGNNWRFQGDYQFHSNDVASVGPSAFTGHGGSGYVDTNAFFADAIYDLNFGAPLVPYLGVGVGVAEVDITHEGAYGAYNNINDDDVVLAYQGIAGVSYAIDRHWQATLDYRYMGTDDPTFRTTTHETVHEQVNDHTIRFGVRYQFGEPAPRPVPVAETMPAPAPQQPMPAVGPAPNAPHIYSVYFDFNKSTLTPEARETLRQVAADIRNGRNVQVSLIGHTDLVGGNRYNQRLSNRRADAVRDELVRLGVPAGEINARGVGKAQPRVPTDRPDEQNRRVEIVVSREGMSQNNGYMQR